MVFQTILQALSSLWLHLTMRLTNLLWTSETATTTQDGARTGTKTHKEDMTGLEMLPLRRQQALGTGPCYAKKPPLAPRKTGRKRRRQIPTVLYIDDDWWDAQGWDTQMMDVEPLPD